MRLIKLDATDSTNAYLKNLTVQTSVEDLTVVVARAQYAGRGQMGTVWDSEPGKNLTFSILKRNEGLDIRQQFVITMEVSLAIYSALRQLQIPDLSVKWPNDILSGSEKICGILIENITSGSRIQSSIIGVGLNVNQMDFGSLQQVSSLGLLRGQPLDLEEVLRILLDSLRDCLGSWTVRPLEDIRRDYEALLFRKDRPVTFQSRDGHLFPGFIRGVSEAGKLRVEYEEGVLREFELKEVKLLY